MISPLLGEGDACIIHPAWESTVSAAKVTRQAGMAMGEGVGRQSSEPGQISRLNLQEKTYQAEGRAPGSESGSDWARQYMALVKVSDTPAYLPAECSPLPGPTAEA